MAGWDDGYVTDVAYTTKFNREMTPAWLAAACILVGQRPPDLMQPFRLADLGCGNGLTDLVIAAAHPEAEIWGFDFNPAHIEWARNLAAAAGLSNVHFIEASFAELATGAAAALPSFDFMVSHGVLSWITQENRRFLIDLLRRHLRPGGLVYMSYNVSIGWPGMGPVRLLMQMLAETNPRRSDLAAPGILDFIDKMHAAKARFFAVYPGFTDRLADMRRQDPRYIAHEFLNRNWTPLMFAESASDMEDAKCQYIGSATLTENFDAISVPPDMHPIVSAAASVVLRETLRDFATAQDFRRDLYRRGAAPLSPVEHRAVLDALSISALVPEIPDPLIDMQSTTTAPEFYRPLAEMLSQGTVPLGRVRDEAHDSQWPVQQLMECVAVLMADNLVHPILPSGSTPQAKAAVQRLNQAIARANALGAELPWIAAPLTGSAMQADILETIMLGAVLSGCPTQLEALTERAMLSLSSSGRTLEHAGEPKEARAIVARLAQNFCAERVPVFERLGIL